VLFTLLERPTFIGNKNRTTIDVSLAGKLILPIFLVKYKFSLFIIEKKILHKDAISMLEQTIQTGIAFILDLKPAISVIFI
jgi:hypothetical protein